MTMKKVSVGLTADMFGNYEVSAKHFVSNDQDFWFMNQITLTLAYLKKFQGKMLAMVKQLGWPTFFLTLSFADLRWNELVESISKLKKCWGFTLL